MQPCIKVQYIALQPLLDPIYIHMLLDPICTYIMEYISCPIYRCRSAAAISSNPALIAFACQCCLQQCWILLLAPVCTVLQQCAVLLAPVLLATVCTVLQQCAVCSVACTSVGSCTLDTVHSVAQCSSSVQCVQYCSSVHLHTAVVLVSVACSSVHTCTLLDPVHTADCQC